MSIIVMLSAFSTVTAVADQKTDLRDKHVRTYIIKGNDAYNKGDYKSAEGYYKQALTENPKSAAANFNLALTLMRIGGNNANTDNPEDKSNPTNLAVDYFNTVTASGDSILAQKAYYNMGNIAFGREDYQESINMYKEALRRNSDDNNARQNLRVAQLKLREQQQNKDQQQNQQNQQNQQDQNQDQNENQKNQNPDQQPPKDNNDKQNKDQQPDHGDKPNEKPQSPPKQQNGGSSPEQGNQQQSISKSNADKILEAMDKKEALTRKKVEQNKEREKARQATRISGNPW